MAFNKYRDKAITTIDKYLNEKYYFDVNNFDLFTLFSIPQDENEFKKAGKELIRAFHPDNLNIFDLTLEQEFCFNFLSKQIVKNFNDTMANNIARLNTYKQKLSTRSADEIQKRNAKNEQKFYQEIEKYKTSKYEEKAKYIMNRFLNNKMYLDNKNLDIFKLFEIEQNEQDFIKKGTHYKDIFSKQKMSKYKLSDDEEFCFTFIVDNIIPKFNDSFTYNMDKIDEYNNNQSKKDSNTKKLEELENERKFKTALKDYKDKKNNPYSRQPNNNATQIMSIVEDCTQKLLNDQGRDYLSYNYFNIFSIPINNSNREILKSLQYQNLYRIFANDVSAFIHEEYKATYLNLRQLFKYFKDNILSDEQKRQAYEQSLNQGGKKANNDPYLNKVMTILLSCIKKLDNSASTTLNYFEIFSVPITASNQQILSSKKYRALYQTFGIDNSSIIKDSILNSRYQELKKLFIMFDENILKKEDGRLHYEQLLKNNNQNNNQYQKEINLLMKKYVDLLRSGSNFDFYDMFGLDIRQDTNSILHNPKLINLLDAFKNPASTYGFIGDQEKIYNELSTLVLGFYNNTLPIEDNRAVYDCNVIMGRYKKRRTQKYEYKYSPYYDGPQGILNKKTRIAYEAVLEYSLNLYGASKTVLFIKEYIETGNNLELGQMMKNQQLPPNGIPLYLRREYGHSSTTLLGRIETSVSDFITTRINIFQGVVENTQSNNYGPNQIAGAIKVYAQTSSPNSFSRRRNGMLGREDLVRYIPKTMLAIITGAILNEDFSFLLDDINDEYKLLENKALTNILAQTITNQNKYKGVAK